MRLVAPPGDLLDQIELFEELMKDDVDEMMERFESIKNDLGTDLQYLLLSNTI